MIDGIKKSFHTKGRGQGVTDIHYQLISKYPEVPHWWYVVVFVVSLAMAFAGLTIYVSDAPKWVFLFPLR